MKVLSLVLTVSALAFTGCGISNQSAESAPQSASRYTIVINRASNTMTLYSAATHQPVQGFISLPVITGAGWATPAGTFHVEDKERCPTWSHPRLGYSGPCAPGNPLGRRWIQFNTSYYGIHGNNAEYLFNNSGANRQLSHGCVRMRNADVERLFEVVSVGDKVIIE